MGNYVQGLDICAVIVLDRRVRVRQPVTVVPRQTGSKNYALLCQPLLLSYYCDLRSRYHKLIGRVG